MRSLAVAMLVILASCSSTAATTTTTSSTTSTTTSTTTTTTIVLPDAPYADQLYTYTVAQLESLMRNFLAFDCDEWTLVENGADRGACLSAGEEVFTYETFPGSVRLGADRRLYESEWREMYADPVICETHAGDHAAIAHSWIVFSDDRATVDVVTEATGAVYLAPPDC